MSDTWATILFVYLFGCFIAFLIQITTRTIINFIYFITKENILIKNIKKISEPDNRTKVKKFGEWALAFLLSVLASWINVIGASIHFIVFIFRFIREIIQTTPQTIKELRWPLRNNPDLSREHVWAYLVALSVKGGSTELNADLIIKEIFNITNYYEDFEKKRAVKILSTLIVINENILNEVENRINNIDSLDSI